MRRLPARLPAAVVQSSRATLHARRGCFAAVPPSAASLLHGVARPSPYNVGGRADLAPCAVPSHGELQVTSAADPNGADAVSRLLSDCTHAASAVALHPHVTALAAQLDRLSLAELLLLLRQCENHGLRHEAAIVAVAWRIVQHPLPRDAPVHVLKPLAIATAAAVRTLAGFGLTNDSHLMAVALGRIAELVPAMQGPQLADVAVALRHFDRLSFTYDEALLSTYGRGGVALKSPSEWEEPYADASRPIDATPRRGHDHDANGSIAQADDNNVGARVPADVDTPSAPDVDPLSLRHPNLIDIVMDAVETRLGELLMGAADVERHQQLLIDAHGTDGAPPAYDGGFDDDDDDDVAAMASRPFSTGAAPPLAATPTAMLVLTPAHVMHLLLTWQRLGVRDLRLVDAVAHQVDRTWRMKLAAAAAAAADGHDTSAAGADGLGDLTPRVVVDLLRAAAGVHLRLVDVLEPAKTPPAHTVAAPLLRALGNALVSINVRKAAIVDPLLVLDLRRTCEALPVIAETAPALWDALRTVRLSRRRVVAAKAGRLDEFNGSASRDGGDGGGPHTTHRRLATAMGFLPRVDTSQPGRSNIDTRRSNRVPPPQATDKTVLRHEKYKPQWARFDEIKELKAKRRRKKPGKKVALGLNKRRGRIAKMNKKPLERASDPARIY